MQNSQTQRLIDDNEEQNRKVKQLEINAHQFYSQLKPLFSENTQLKQNLIELNVYIEERKMQLCKFLSDTGPNGEDLILAKAVGDLQQICDLIGEEMIRLRNEIKNFVVLQNEQKQTLKEVREQLQNEIKRSIDEKQQLINQNSTNQQIYKSQIDLLKHQNEIYCMKTEDLQSLLLRQSEAEIKLRNKYQIKLEEETSYLRQELNHTKLLRQEEIDKYDIERRVFLKQLELFSGKMKQMKQDTVDEYEYKLASQKSKLDNQIKIIQQENSELKLQLSQFREKYRQWTIQQEVLIDQKYKLELQNKDLKNLISYLEEKLITQEEISIQTQNELNQQKSTISQMKQSTNQKKKSMTASQISSSQQSQKQQSKSNTPIQESRSSSTQLWQKASTALKKLPRDSLKIMESQKIKVPEETKFQTNTSAIQKKNSYTQPSVQDEQFVEKEKFKKLGSIQELHFEHISSATLSQRMDLRFIDACTQTEEIQQISHDTPQQRGRISSVFRTRQQFVQQFSYNHVETQYEGETNDVEYINFKQDLLVSQLQNKLLSTQQMCDLKLEQRKEDIEDLQKQISQLQKSYESQLKQVEIELNLIHSEEFDKKLKEIEVLKDQNEKANDKIKSLEEAVKLFEINQESIHQQYENKLIQKDVEIKNKEEKVIETQNIAQQEQTRLLQLNQSQREQYQMEIKNLENQHLLDQEKIQQEQNRYLDEKQFIEQTKQENLMMLEQIKKKEFILDNYKSELIKTNEVVKYLQLELENYKKLNNIFKSRNESPPSFLANGFLSSEIQDRIKQRLQKSKISKDNPRFGFQTRDVYGMNFQIQRREKLKQAKLGNLNTSFEDKSFTSGSKNLLFKLRENEESQTLQVNSRRMMTDDNKSCFEIKKKPQHIKKNQRAKTQLSDYSDSKLLVHDIFEREITVLNRSNQFLNQLNDQPTKFRSIHSTHQATKKKLLQNR